MTYFYRQMTNFFLMVIARSKLAALIVADKTKDQQKNHQNIPTRHKSDTHNPTESFGIENRLIKQLVSLSLHALD